MWFLLKRHKISCNLFKPVLKCGSIYRILERGPSSSDQMNFRLVMVKTSEWQMILWRTVKFSDCLMVVVVVSKWRGHVENITCMALAEDHQLLMTSSLDCTVRLWTFSGHYVGMSTYYTVSPPHLTILFGHLVCIVDLMNRDRLSTLSSTSLNPAICWRGCLLLMSVLPQENLFKN